MLRSKWFLFLPFGIAAKIRLEWTNYFCELINVHESNFLRQRMIIHISPIKKAIPLLKTMVQKSFSIRDPI